MRRKPMQGGRPNHSNNNNGGQHRRHSGGGGGHYNNNRPRKNYPQLREKYINQAKDALSAGDRVMAEYYFQHADHCYRMMVEEGYRPQSEQQQQQQQNDQNSGQQENANGGSEPQVNIPQSNAEESDVNPGALPTFLTMGYTAAASVSNAQQAAAEPSQGQWEEN